MLKIRNTDSVNSNGLMVDATEVNGRMVCNMVKGASLQLLVWRSLGNGKKERGLNISIQYNNKNESKI